MQIISSTRIKKNYSEISDLAKNTGEPIFITSNGNGDTVLMSIEAFEEREKAFIHRDKIYAAEISRLMGEPTYTVEEVDSKISKLFDAYGK